MKELFGITVPESEDEIEIRLPEFVDGRVKTITKKIKVKDANGLQLIRAGQNGAKPAFLPDAS
jgi:hypothetical protein